MPKEGGKLHGLEKRLRELPYREFSGVDAIEVVVAHGADVDGAAELPDKQPLVELLVEEGIDLEDIQFQLWLKLLLQPNYLPEFRQFPR